MQSKQYLITTEKGFYKDFFPSFVFTAKKEEANRFDHLQDAEGILSGLKIFGHARQGRVIEVPYDGSDDDNLAHLINLAAQVVAEAEANAAANPTSEEILVVIVEPMKKPYKKVIPNNAEAFRDIVGGWLENVTIGETAKGARASIIINEEGKLIGLPFNRRIIGRGGVDTFVGNFIVTAYNLEGDNVSLTEIEADKFIRKFAPLEVYL